MSRLLDLNEHWPFSGFVGKRISNIVESRNISTLFRLDFDDGTCFDFSKGDDGNVYPCISWAAPKHGEAAESQHATHQQSREKDRQSLVQFIGGSIDGERHFIPDRLNRVYAPAPPHGEMIYFRKILNTEGKDFHFFLAGGLSISRAIDRLFDSHCKSRENP